MSVTYNLINMSEEQLDLLIRMMEMNVKIIAKAVCDPEMEQAPAYMMHDVEEILDQVVALLTVLRETRKGGYNGAKK